MVQRKPHPGTAAWLLLAGALVLCGAVYAPGLYGSFVFDDTTFILANSAMHVTTLRLGDWAAAAMSFPASHQGRWLGMLSFAANHYFTALDPFWLKLTNLVIHLFNGTLLFLALRALFGLRRDCRPDLARSHTFDEGIAAAAIAALWLLLPINLTAVLYVSQRLEALSNTFVFLGLWWYLCARRAHRDGTRGPAGLWLSLVVSTGVGVLVKESAALLPLYALCVELAISGARDRSGRWSRPVVALFAVLIGIPLVAGGIWLASWIGAASSYARPFGTIERLLTEARVLIDYIQWTLLPQPESLTLYHDDIAISHGLLDPPSTLASVAALLVLLGVAIRQRARRPLFSVGVLWFFCAHLLTGTVIPLLLAFEHRNYFASAGLLLAGASLVALEGGLTRFRVRALLVACLAVFYAFTTWMRAEEWSAPLRLALSEANKRPDSSSAQYALAHVLLHSQINGEAEPMRQQAFDVLARAARIPGSDILPEQLLIVSHAELGQPPDPAWWDSLLAKLRARPPTTSDISGLSELLRCYSSKVCSGSIEPLRRAFEAAVAHESTDSVLLTAYGQLIESYLDDPALAEKQLRAAVAAAPRDPTTRSNLVIFLMHHRRFAQARSELESLKKINYFGALDGRLAKLDAMLRDSERTRDSATPDAGAAHP